MAISVACQPYGWSCSIEESYKLTDQLQSEVGLLSTNIGNGARLCSRAEPDDMSEECSLTAIANTMGRRKNHLGQ